MRTALAGGALGLGALLFAAVPASAATAPAEKAEKVTLVSDASTAQTAALASDCRYGGYIIYSDGTVVHVVICSE
ncbi:hypothetical protein ACFVHW_27110 [Streptomyces sp. NPDC127110]|uniref:hypothetical protein n=1 Tax=Streptomyces sp. NPDC127110 TaxID=3345362 RepID=UPI0036315FDF